MRNGRAKGIEQRVSRIRKSECGLRPIGAYAYAPAGSRNIGAEGKIIGTRRKAQGARQRAECKRQKTDCREY